MTYENPVLKTLFEAKSVRVYEDKAIEKEKLDLILEAAFRAPTAGNQMLYSIINITEQERKEKLAVLCDNQPFIAKAPVVLVSGQYCIRSDEGQGRSATYWMYWYYSNQL